MTIGQHRLAILNSLSDGAVTFAILAGAGRQAFGVGAFFSNWGSGMEFRPRISLSCLTSSRRRWHSASAASSSAPPSCWGLIRKDSADLGTFRV